MQNCPETVISSHFSGIILRAFSCPFTDTFPDLCYESCFPENAENAVPEPGFQEKPGIFRARGGFLLSLAVKEGRFFPGAVINV
jgi:hypothetical protein